VAPVAAKRARGGVRSGPDDARKVWHISRETPPQTFACFGVLWVQNHPNHQARGEYADHTPQGAWAPVAGLMGSKPVLFSALIVGLLPVQAFAQKLQVAYWTGPVALVPRTPDDLAGETKTCWIQPFPGMTNMASVTSLQIPH
jgi:hypothetical protein